MRALVKYWFIWKISISEALVYFLDFVGRSGFFAFIMGIYLFLWKAIYGESGAVLDGFTLDMMIWYLVFTEIVTLSTTDYYREIAEDVKSGQIAYLLNKPYNYIAYNYFNTMGKIMVRLLVNTLVGFLVALCFVGPLKSMSLISLPVTFLGIILGISINFFLNFALALTAFWVEENTPFRWVFQKMVFTLGGMLLPLDLFPGWLQKISVHLPFAYITYGPAKMGVAFEPSYAIEVLVGQLAYLAGSILLTMFVFSKGVKKLNVNGG